MSNYLVLLILEFLPARLATLPYVLDSNVTQLLANMLTKPSVFYYLPIVPCNLVSIKLLLLLLLLLLFNTPLPAHQLVYNYFYRLRHIVFFYRLIWSGWILNLNLSSSQRRKAAGNRWNSLDFVLAWQELPNQKNIYGAALALIAIMYVIMQGIIAVASLLATMALYGNGRDPQRCMSGIDNTYYSYHCGLIGQSTVYL